MFGQLKKWIFIDNRHLQPPSCSLTDLWLASKWETRFCRQIRSNFRQFDVFRQRQRGMFCQRIWPIRKEEPKKKVKCFCFCKDSWDLLLPFWGPNVKFNNINDFWKTTTCIQRPLLWGTNGAFCAQVWLYCLFDCIHFSGNFKIYDNSCDNLTTNHS